MDAFDVLDARAASSRTVRGRNGAGPGDSPFGLRGAAGGVELGAVGGGANWAGVGAGAGAGRGGRGPDLHSVRRYTQQELRSRKHA